MFVEIWVPPGRRGVVYAFARDSNEVRPQHHHDELEFNLVVRGVGRFRIGERRVDLTPRRLVWFLPAQDHGLEGQSADFAMWIVLLRRDLSAAYLGRAPRVLLPSLSSQVRALDAPEFSTLCEWCERSRFGRCDPRDDALLFLLQRALTGSRVPAPAVVHPAVDEALRLLTADPNVGRAALASRLGLADETLSRKFSEAMGVSLPIYKNRLRLGRFLEIVREGHSNLLRAALDAGFGSYAQFHRVLREQTGTSPAEFVRQDVRTMLMSRTADCARIDCVTK